MWNAVVWQRDTWITGETIFVYNDTCSNVVVNSPSCNRVDNKLLLHRDNGKQILGLVGFKTSENLWHNLRTSRQCHWRSNLNLKRETWLQGQIHVTFWGLWETQRNPRFAQFGFQNTVLRSVRGKPECLMYEMLFIQEKKCKLNTQSDSIKVLRTSTLTTVCQFFYVIH